MGSTVGTIALSDDHVLWTISDFVSLPHLISFNSPEFIFIDKTWQLSIYPRGSVGNLGWFGLELYNCNRDGEQSIRVRFGLREKFGKVSLKCKAEPMYNYWYFQAMRIIQFKDIVSRSREFLPGGVIQIYCEIIKKGSRPSIQYGVLSSVKKSGNARCIRTEDVEEKQDIKSKSIDRLQQDFKELLLSGQNSDVTLRVRGTVFRVHRRILAARSPVFSAMFLHNMTEKATGIVDIEDSDPDTFPDFLHYLYTGRVKNMSSKKVLELYTTADKYQMPELKEECLDFMTKNVTVDNICDFLVLSLQHQEKELTEAATQFFLENGREIVVTSKWVTFLRENTVAGNELFIKFIGA